MQKNKARANRWLTKLPKPSVRFFRGWKKKSWACATRASVGIIRWPNLWWAASCCPFSKRAAGTLSTTTPGKPGSGKTTGGPSSSSAPEHGRGGRPVPLLGEGELENLKSLLVKTLVEKKIFYKFRFMGKKYFVAIDGTGVASYGIDYCGECTCKTSKNGKTTYFHNVLEARLVTCNGMSVSMAT